MTIIDAIKSKGYATNDFQAAHIANGLRLYELETEAEQLARVALYRRWRSKTDKKNDIPAWQAFQLAIAGVDPDDVVERQIRLPGTPDLTDDWQEVV